MAADALLTRSVLTPAAIAAAAVPALLAYNTPPSSTLLNQAFAVFGWGVFALFTTNGLTRSDALRAVYESSTPAALSALAILLTAALASPLWTHQPWSLALSNAGMLAATIVLLLAGATAAASNRAPALCQALCWAWLVAGVASVAIGTIQVFFPELPDGDWIARTSFVGRAVGNLRQPNHLSSLLLWSAIGVVGLAESSTLPKRLAPALLALMVGGIVMTASRTGLVGVLMLALWGIVDRRLRPATRWTLLAAPIAYAAAWIALSAWAHASQHVFGGEGRLTADGDLSSSRFAIWSNTLALIASHPLFGVGFGEFNFAWSLTPFPHRPVAFFDHTHNLLLQFAVELGLPLAALVFALLGWALWRAFQNARVASGNEGLSLRVALMMVLMMVLHSQLEYPLWYAYFLLPTALCLGLCLAGADRSDEKPAANDRRASTPTIALRASALALMAAAVFVIADYFKVVVIFAPGDSAAPLADRIAEGQHSIFFAHHADYAAATTAEHPGNEMPAFAKAAHYLLDARLMTAWSRAYAERGDLERARHLAARLREFHHEQSVSFLAECDAPASAASGSKPFQCTPPKEALDERAFR